MLNFKRMIMLFFVAVLLTSCSLANINSRLPEEWMTLANSGLAGRDNYTYSAHVETGVNKNIKVSMYNFNGQVKSHHEYSVNNEEADATLLHPAKYMSIMNNKENEIIFSNEPLDPEATTANISLTVNEKSETATLRWRALLKQQFNNVKLISDSIHADKQMLNSIKEIIESSEMELDEMLSTLQVNSSYKVVVHAKSAVPLELEEYAVLNYKRDGKPYSEYRISHININY